ncbi:DUF3667 domain-containing protein [Hyphococcus flavus]|uniref:DUF3667 domain-containing protein n=1 Tax=Hyphococcus flavus TaxID=1866326 RepID=A0AAF0CC05_9PROT|nr:DUF3667 domain-containing protein [Hyphococcus flavus]WDI32260.1 DUF3667 domain-containing protein [Hyphococcus flavus]
MTDAISNCKNCGAKLTGEYCQSCGQRADEPRRVVIGLVQDFLVDTLAIDGKLARTIWLLLSRPGRLARRYLDGQRVRYSPPFRLYLFASVFFFLAAFATFTPGGKKLASDLSAAIDGEDLTVSESVMAEMEARDPGAAAELRELQREIEAETQQADADEETSESEENDNGVSLRDTKWEDTNYSGPEWLKPYVRQLYESAQFAMEDPRLFFAESRENLPRVMLLAPAVYALILLLLYVYRRKFYVYDHFVISLYMHAALYAYLLLALLLGKVPIIGELFAALVLIWGAFQPLLVFRQAYGSNWISVVLKWVISTALYYMALIFIIMFGIFFSLYQSGA